MIQIDIIQEWIAGQSDSALTTPHKNSAIWYSQLESSHWMEYISYLLSSGYRVAQLLEENQRVIVHCSDGWDRTPQLCSVAQLLIDPYYRTIFGFISLIEKGILLEFSLAALF